MKSTIVALTLAMALNFAAAASAQVPAVPSADERRHLPDQLQTEAQTQAANVWAEVLAILDELDDSPGLLFPCEPITFSAGINETDPANSRPAYLIRPECLPV